MSMSKETIRQIARNWDISEEEAETAKYLGDGVYAFFYGANVWLRTLEGNAIALEHAVTKQLIEYAILHQGEME